MPLVRSCAAAPAHRGENGEPRLASRAARGAARLLDWAVASSGQARPAMFISGFWRSGTTWLQECVAEALDAKTVFEPLSPKNPTWGRRLAAAGLADPDLREAYIPDPLAEDDPAWRYLDRSVFAVRGSYFTLSCRRGVGESLRRLIVVKDVRAQRNLRAAHLRYGIPVVHLRRHPCAVVASLAGARWSWSFERVRLAELTAPFGAAEDCRRFDTDALSRIAAYWALTEREAEAQLADEPWGCVLGYEQAVAAPFAVTRQLCGLAGLPQRRAPRPETDSAMTHPEAIGLPPRERLERWRERLSRAEIERVREVVEALHPPAAAQYEF